MRAPRVAVVKVGGSLLRFDQFATELARWLHLNQDAQTHFVLVVGGGQLVEAIRQRRELDEQESHWKAIEAMGTNTARVSKQLLPTTTVSDYDQLRVRVAEPGRTIFDCQEFLWRIEPKIPGTRLAEGWDVTSDSIAGRLAIALAAEVLVLLKSASPASASCEELSSVGFVDPFLAQLSPELPPTHITNLRDAAFPTARMTA